MAIYRLLQDGAFEPEHIELVATAYEDTLRAMRLTNRADPVTELIAKAIFEMAQTGERHPDRLREMTLAKLGIVKTEWLESFEAAKTGAQRGPKETPGRVVDSASLSTSLGVLVRAAIEKAEGGARAAFYISNGAKLHHIIGMPEAYARYVDGFPIGPQLLACGLAASRGQAIITRDVAEEPLWEPWLWLAKQFDYRACWSFPVETSAGMIVGTFAMYYRDPREAAPRDLDLAATITRAAAIIIISPQLADK
jgi:GAF domain-containing protein